MRERRLGNAEEAVRCLGQTGVVHGELEVVLEAAIDDPLHLAVVGQRLVQRIEARLLMLAGPAAVVARRRVGVIPECVCAAFPPLT